MILFWQRSRTRRGEGGGSQIVEELKRTEVGDSRRQAEGRGERWRSRCVERSLSYGSGNAHNANNANNAHNANNALASLKSVHNGGMTTIRKLRSGMEGQRGGADATFSEGEQ